MTHLRHGRPELLLTCLTLEDSMTLTAICHIMGKSQKVKCPVSSVILPVKLYEPGLFRMQRQSIFTQAFPKYFQHPICICFICKTHYKIIRISDHTALTLQQWRSEDRGARNV